jgi:hypothetical protein
MKRIKQRSGPGLQAAVAGVLDPLNAFVLVEAAVARLF